MNKITTIAIFVLFTLILLAFITVNKMLASYDNPKVGDFYISKLYPNSFEKQKVVRDTIQLTAVSDNAVKWVNFIGWEISEPKPQFFASFERCLDCKKKIYHFNPIQL